MAWFKRIFDFYLDASIHVGLAILSLVHSTVLMLNITVPFAFYMFIFFGSICCYNFIKYGVEAKKYILVANRYHKGIQFFSLGCLAGALYFLFFLPDRIFIGLVILGGITALYALPVLPKHKNFRSLSGLKILIVATVWAGTTVILPVLAQGVFISWDVRVETFQRFLLVLVLLIPFEIRDLKYDQPELKTLPQRFGVNVAKTIGIAWTCLFYGSTFLKTDLEVVELSSKTMLFLVLLAVIIRTKRNQNRYFSSFWIEAIPLFWWTVIVIGKRCF